MVMLHKNQNESLLNLVEDFLRKKSKKCLHLYKYCSIINEHDMTYDDVGGCGYTVTGSFHGDCPV